MPAQLQIQGGPTVSPVVISNNIDLMARKALQEEMPGIMLRGIIRSSGKAIAQYEAGKNDQTGLIGLALAIGSMVTESADERGWRSLPAQIAIARARIPAGQHTMGFSATRPADATSASPYRDVTRSSDYACWAAPLM